MKKIAEMSGVSIGTVDRVLHNRCAVKAETRERVWQIARELNYRPNYAAQRLAARKKKLQLGMLVPEFDSHPFFRDVWRAAQEKAAGLQEYGVQVRFMEMDTSYAPAVCRTDGRDAEEVVRTFLEGLDGLTLCGVALPQALRILSAAREKEIPVVFYNVRLPGEKVLAYVGCDYEKSGRLAAGLTALCAGESANVCIYSEDFFVSELAGSQTESSFGRLEGFRAEMRQRYPRMRLLDLRQVSLDPEENVRSAREMFQKFPDVDVVYVLNPGDYSICRAIFEADERRRVRIIVNDLTEGPMTEMLQKGMIAATITQEPERQGAEPLEILFQYLTHGIVPDQEQCYTKLSICIAQNI